MRFKKLSYRIVFTYVLVLAVFFLLITSIVKTTFSGYMEKETLSKLKSESDAICNLLQDKNLNKAGIAEILSQRKKLNVAGQFISAQVMVVNLYNERLYSDIVDPVYVKIFRDTNEIYISDPDYYHVLRAIGYRNSISGYVVLLIQKGNLAGINEVISKSLRISFAISAAITLFLIAFLEKSITGPVSLLNKKISDFNVGSPIYLPSINTGDEIEKLDESFVKMAKRIKAYDARQKEFFQNTSHELKTPLMSIQGYAEGIREGVFDEAEMDEAVDVIISECQRVKKTVDSITYLTKLENVVLNFDFQEHNLIEIIEHAMVSVKSLAKEKEIEMTLHGETEVRGHFDAEKIQRALINILSNDIRYAKNMISISVKVKDDWINIIISDDGKGFSEEEEKKVFDRFYKGEGGNTGLGLSIVKAIISGHNGTVIAYNGIKKGAVFDIKIPQK